VVVGVLESLESVIWGPVELSCKLRNDCKETCCVLPTLWQLALCIASAYIQGSLRASIENFSSGIFVWFIILAVNAENEEGGARCKN
jgi:hypothetical protein